MSSHIHKYTILEPLIHGWFHNTVHKIAHNPHVTTYQSLQNFSLRAKITTETALHKGIMNASTNYEQLCFYISLDFTDYTFSFVGNYNWF